MSYCRLLEGDVYAYECDGGVQFWVAGRSNKQLDRLCNTFNEAYQYAKTLRDEHGLAVPNHVIEALMADAIDEAERFCWVAVSELEAENALNRKQCFCRKQGRFVPKVTAFEGYNRRSGADVRSRSDAGGRHRLFGDGDGHRERRQEVIRWSAWQTGHAARGTRCRRAG